MHFPIFLCHALLKEFFRDASQLRRYSSLDGLYAFKTGPFDDPPELEEKKSNGSRAGK